MRKVLILVAVTVLFLFGGWLWLSGWTGASSDTELRAGDVVELDSGLRITVPDGYSGYVTTYYRFPRWLRIGQSMNPSMGQLSQTLALDAGGQESPSHLMSVTYQRNDPQRPGSLIVRSDTTSVHQSVPGKVTIVTTLPNREKGYVFFLTEGTDPLVEARKAWALFDIRGATLP